MEPDMSVEATRYVYALRDISPSQKAVLVRLADHANDAGKAWPSVASLVRATGFCRRAVQKALRDLEKLGHIRTTHQITKAGDPGSNTYELCNLRGSAPDARGSAPDARGSAPDARGSAPDARGSAPDAPLSGIPIESPLNQIPPFPQTGFEVGPSQGEPDQRANAKARKPSERTQARAEHGKQAIVLLSELSAARRRCNPACDELKPLPANLGELTGRLREGHTADEIRNVIAYLEADVKAGRYKAEYFNAVNPFRRSNFGGHLGKSPDSIHPAQPVRQSYQSEAATVIPRGLPDTPLDRRIAESQRQELARKKNAHAPTPTE